MFPTMPALFVSHGAPTLVSDPVPTRDFLLGLGKSLPRPRAILAVSAHWDTPAPRLSATPEPETIHDFYGFPDELYDMAYPAPGEPTLAGRAASLIDGAGLSAALDPSRGLDHGAWVPLSLMYPQADIPVAQVSVQSHLPPNHAGAHHLALGRALAPLREEGILILASGNATHNLREVFQHDINAAPAPYAREFADWLTGRIQAGDQDALADYLEQGPNAARCHPLADHYVPLLVAAGAGGGKGRLLHDGWTYSVLSMAAYAWD